MSKLGAVACISFAALVSLGVAALLLGYHRYWEGVEERAVAELTTAKDNLLEGALTYAPRDSLPTGRHLVVKHRAESTGAAYHTVRVLIDKGRIALFHRAPEDSVWSSDDPPEDQITALNRLKTFVRRARSQPITLGP